MRRETVGEWILRSAMTHDRAATIIGDFSEADVPQSQLKFWLCIAGILLAATWTWIVALAIGVYLATWSVDFLNGQLFGQALSAWDLGPHPLRMTPLGLQCLDGLARFSTLLLLLAPYVVTRYGIRDKLTRVLVGSLVLIFGTTCLWWLPGGLAICTAAGVIGIVACAWTRARRRALGITVSAALAGAYSSPVASWLVSLVHHPAFGCELRGCVGQTPALAASQLFLAAPVALVCTLMYGRLMEHDTRQSDETPELA